MGLTLTQAVGIVAALIAVSVLVAAVGNVYLTLGFLAALLAGIVIVVRSQRESRVSR